MSHANTRAHIGGQTFKLSTCPNYIFPIFKLSNCQPSWTPNIHPLLRPPLSLLSPPAALLMCAGLKVFFVVPFGRAGRPRQKPRTLKLSNFQTFELSSFQTFKLQTFELATLNFQTSFFQTFHFLRYISNFQLSNLQTFKV